MLSTTKVNLVTSDVEMYLFFEKCMWDGVLCICRRYNKTNNKYLTSYGPKNKQNITIDLEKIILYGYTMSKFLPTGWFKWSDPIKFKIDVIKTVWEVAF